MPTERCSSLTIKGLYHNFDEMWISEHPALSLAYLGEYFPRLARMITNKFIAKKRLENYYASLKLKQ